MRTSSLWRFFEPVDLQNASCNLCDKELSYKSTTSNLRKHLKSKHPSAIENLNGGNNGESVAPKEERSGSTSPEPNSASPTTKKVPVKKRYSDENEEESPESFLSPYLTKKVQVKKRRREEEPMIDRRSYYNTRSSPESSRNVRSEDVDAFGLYIGKKLKLVKSEEQKMLAENLIVQVLQKAIFNRLTENTILVGITKVVEEFPSASSETEPAAVSVDCTT